MSPVLSWPVLRGLVLAVLTWLVVSAVLLPQYNPFTRKSALGAAQAGAVWAEIAQWRLALSEAVAQEDEWPADLQPLAPPGLSGLVQVSSPAPYQLGMRVADRPELGALAGTQVLLRMDAPSRHWSCRAGQPAPPPRLLPLNCERADSSGSAPAEEYDPFGWLRTLMLVCAGVFLAAGALWLLRHPLIGPAQLRPARLRRTPLERLAPLDRLLRWTGRLRATLVAAAISPRDWQRALRYTQANPTARAQALAERVAARCQAAQDWPLPGHVFVWAFAPDMPVALDRCVAYFPPPELSASSLVQRLRTLTTGADVLLVCAPHSDETPLHALAGYTADRANLHVLLDSPSQTEWLLAPDAQAVLLRVLTEQLRVTRISPYQTRGGVTREDAFFGRERLLARILGREPANYLVVGGRQLGKSSLLKAVQRRLRDHPQIVCHYVSLRDHRLAPRLAAQFALDVHTPLDGVIAHLQAQDPRKRIYLLVDEADQFFRDQSRSHYAGLAALRALSDEGRCCFILAGFWDLYEAAVLDYQSPLRNFGEVLAIGALEHDACLRLATEPLQRLRLAFAHPGLAERLAQASGQRANLVSILCQECLEALQGGERAIELRHLNQALASQAVQDTLAGWSRLSSDPTACRLDRIAVYHTARHGCTGLAPLNALLEAHGIPGQARALQTSLARLQMAYVLRRQEAEYRFAVPLLQQQFEPSEVEVLLAQELQALARG